MGEIRVEGLYELTKMDVDRLIVGYTSTRRYDICKKETPDVTEIVFELVDLSEPFEKRWHYDEAMVDWLRSLLTDGLSAGAWDDDVLIGLAVAQKQSWNDTAIVCELHVDARFKRQGAGRRMLAWIEAAATAAGLRCVSIETQTPNVDAIAFYRGCGYALDGCDLSYYDNDDRDRGEVALFMKKVLT